ncbi:hypothetical protein OY671_007354 [Metschnikowia pulcherrima]|nr:hypothetical protein OY671_007354 [Metschnikowia pulcherrima]
MDKSGYTYEQLEQMMTQMYQNTGTGKQNVIYDSMNTILEILLGHHCLFRSRNKRILEISDTVFPLLDSGKGKVRVLGFKFTEGKTLGANTAPQQMGAFRSKNVMTCLVSAFVMSLWYRLDFDTMHGSLTGKRFPDFLKKSDWYNIKVLWSTRTMNSHEPISYNYEASLVKKCLKVINVKFSKLTHLGRCVSARNADAKRVEQSQVRRAGKWRIDTMEKAYMSAYPMEFLHHSAEFGATEQYSLPRDIEPPE